MARAARMSDIAYNTVQSLCKEPDRNVDLYTLNKLSIGLRVPVMALLEEEDFRNLPGSYSDV